VSPGRAIFHYQILITKTAQKELEAVDGVKYRQKIVAQIESLAGNPRPVNCSKLVGLVDLYRVRVGMYRIVYSIRDSQLIVEVIKIADRKEVYR
jgi:mRNA interferase RelE/StbE